VTPQGAPVAGTVLRLRDTDYKATADSRGFLEIIDLLPGPYSAVVEEPTLATVGLTFETPLSFVAGRDSAYQVQVEIPTPDEYIAGACRADRTSFGGTAWVLGRVAGGSGLPIAGAYWTVQRPDGAGSAAPGAPRRTGPDGLFRVCDGLELGTTVEIRVWTDGVPPVVVVRELTERVTIAPIALPAGRDDAAE
jgi:hypothetical protein